MTITNGAGVEERQEDWTVESIFEDWIADKKLSRRKVTWLEAHINEWLDFMEQELLKLLVTQEKIKDVSKCKREIANIKTFCSIINISFYS